MVCVMCERAKCKCYTILAFNQCCSRCVFSQDAACQTQQSSTATQRTIVFSDLRHEGRLRLRLRCISRLGTGFAFSLLVSFLSLSIHNCFPCGSCGWFTELAGPCSTTCDASGSSISVALRFPEYSSEWSSRVLTSSRTTYSNDIELPDGLLSFCRRPGVKSREIVKWGISAYPRGSGPTQMRVVRIFESLYSTFRVCT